MQTKRTLTQADADFLQKQFSKIFATKSDLKGFATKSDLVDQGEKLEKLVTKFKDDFYTKIDPILKEVIASREERTIQAAQHRRNEHRIEKLEKIHPNFSHVTTI